MRFNHSQVTGGGKADGEKGKGDAFGNGTTWLEQSCSDTTTVVFRAEFTLQADYL